MTSPKINNKKELSLWATITTTGNLCLNEEQIHPIPVQCPLSSTLCQYSVNIAAFLQLLDTCRPYQRDRSVVAEFSCSLQHSETNRQSWTHRLKAATSTWSKDIQVWADLSDDDPRLWERGSELGGDLIILQSSDTTPDPPISDSRPNNNLWQIRIVICSRTPDYEAMTNWGEVGSGDRDEKLWPSLKLPAKQLPGTDSSRPPVHCGRQTHSCT